MSKQLFCTSGTFDERRQKIRYNLSHRILNAVVLCNSTLMNDTHEFCNYAGRCRFAVSEDERLYAKKCLKGLCSSPHKEDRDFAIASLTQYFPQNVGEEPQESPTLLDFVNHAIGKSPIDRQKQAEREDIAVEQVEQQYAAAQAECAQIPKEAKRVRFADQEKPVQIAEKTCPVGFTPEELALLEKEVTLDDEIEDEKRYFLSSQYNGIYSNQIEDLVNLTAPYDALSVENQTLKKTIEHLQRIIKIRDATISGLEHEIYNCR